MESPINVVQCNIYESYSFDKTIWGIIMAFSIRLTEEEKRLAESYAKVHSMSIGEAFKRALFEKIEDEYDIVVFKEAYDDYVKSGKKSASISKLWKENDL